MDKLGLNIRMVRLKINRDHLESCRVRDDNYSLVSIYRYRRNGMDGCARLHIGALLAMLLHWADIFGHHAAGHITLIAMQ